MSKNTGSDEITGSQFLIRTLAAIGVLGILAFGYHVSNKPEVAKPIEDKKGKFTGNSYHSTALRARERAREQMEKVDEVRKEQIKEELEFDKK